MNAILLLLIFLAFGGFLLSFYIGHTKRKGEKLICPIGADCNAVVYSRYSRFWGIPVEIFGLAYFGLVAVSYILFLAYPALATSTTIFWLLGITIVAFLFSLHQTFVQAFTLKKWCSWCLIVAALSTIIFALSLISNKFNLTYILAEQRDFILVLYVVSMALGVGGATIADVFFLRFLKHLKISETETEIIHLLSQFIWFALALIVLSTIGLYLPEAAMLNQSSQFLAKMIVILIIIINGTLLNLLISPKIISIALGEKHSHEPGELHKLRKLAFALGAISLVSWYSAFILGMLENLAQSLSAILLVYAVLVVAAVVASQIIEYLFDKEVL